MKIKIERSGGVTGVPITNEIDVKDLPPKLLPALKKIVVGKKSSSLPLKSAPKGAADYFTYKISIQDGLNKSIIECNQFNIQDDLKLLIKYLEKNSRPK